MSSEEMKRQARQQKGEEQMEEKFYLKKETKSREKGEVNIYIEIVGNEESVKTIKRKIMATFHEINRGHNKQVGYRIRCLYQQNLYPHIQ